MLREKRKNIQYLTSEEAAKLMAVLRDESDILSHRNRAVGFLLLFTGLRGCYIAALMLDSIDWQAEKISVFQQKTENPVDLPLIPLVGNAIYDYLSLERPDIQDRHLFLTESRPCCGLSSRSVGNIVAKIFSAAGMRQKPGSRKGTHIFRHIFATRCFELDIPPKTVQLLLGHSSIQMTMDLYTHVSEQKKQKDMQKLEGLFQIG